jgi:serine/threonine protein kinase
MGTVGYMSPEQAQGKIDIDSRSDTFSFGCILFEVGTVTDLSKISH